MISTAQRAVFRDVRSQAIAKRAGFHRNVEVAPDIAFAYRQPFIPVKRFSRRPTIGVVVFSYSSFPMDNMAKLLSHLNQKGFHLTLIPVIHHPGNAYSDFGTCLQLQQKVKELTPHASIETLPFLMDIELTYSFIQSADYLLSFKLHPSLVALRQVSRCLPSVRWAKCTALCNPSGSARMSSITAGRWTNWWIMLRAF
ncbi:Polysaccharide pyruvyl transferase [Paenibacillus sp. P1XP2]|nr:Polysaccharide pyruvyl transferase [Paenibacillus sp. P1XP2]